MKNLNVVILTGNIGQAATNKAFENGNGVIEFSIAENQSYKNKAGEWENKTTWHNCKLFTKKDNLDKLTPVFTKGSNISIQGKLDYDTYEKTIGEQPVEFKSAFINVSQFDVKSAKED